MKPEHLQVLVNSEAVARKVAETILDYAFKSIEQCGRFTLVLAGGTTPKRAYQLLAQSHADWSQWYIFYGDERCLPADDADRNSVMARESWLERVAIPECQIFPIPAEKGAVEGAKAYAKSIQAYLPFDLVLLGMGEDGHSASLFPGHEHTEDLDVVVVDKAPKPPSQRISLSYQLLIQKTRTLLMVITGTGKRKAVDAWFSGQDLPIAKLSQHSECWVFMDQDAMQEKADT